MPNSAPRSLVLNHRSTGILLHPTSLPGPGPQGSLGVDADRFLGFLHASQATVWQMLPLNPPHRDGSPYQARSAFAGDPRLIDLQQLAGMGLIDPDDIDLAASGEGRARLLCMARAQFGHSISTEIHDDYDAFKQIHAHWLDDYALYSAIHRQQHEQSWLNWPEPLRNRDSQAMNAARKELIEPIHQCEFEQFWFFRQWNALRQNAREKDIRLFGDMPLYVALDSADVWSRRDLFLLDAAGYPAYLAGVPPDYFSTTGQLWGNPLYDWNKMQEDRFSWWVDRLKCQMELFDSVRVDHFRGFDSCWAVPPDEETAKNGHWEPTPGRALLDTLRQAFGTLPLVAEDLGIITQDVEKLRDDYGLPGMKILQFAFESGANNPYLPHNHIRDCVVYTGTHDNDTTLGWFESRSPDIQNHVMDYLGKTTLPMPWALIRSALASVAQLSILPMQDVLGLDGSARMNTPGSRRPDNWKWRFCWEQMKPDLAERLQHLNQLYSRL